MPRETHTINSQQEVVDFWQHEVITRLGAQRMLLMFVANDIPDELEPVVKFLNEQMQGIEVLAVEIKQHTDAVTSGQTLEQGVIGHDEPGGLREDVRNKCLCGCGVPKDKSNFVTGHDARLNGTLGRVEDGKFPASDCDLRYAAERCQNDANVFHYNESRLFYNKYSPADIIRLAKKQAAHRQRN